MSRAFAFSGVGYWIAYRLLERAAAQNELSKWDVILGCRSVDKAEAARQQLLGVFKGARVSVMQVDTSSPASVKKFCAEFKQRCVVRLRCFLINAN